MGIVNSALNAVFNLLLSPFRSLNPWAAMVALSLLTGILMLFVFRLTSNQEGIRRVKNRIKAHLLELRLFKDNMGTSFRAYGNILWNNLKYIAHTFRPLLVMIIPLMLILIQMNFWFGYRSLSVGERFLIKVRLAQGYSPVETALTIQASPAYAVETPPLRMEEEGEVDWRLQALQAGRHEIRFETGGRVFTKSLDVGQKPLSRISPLKPGGNFWDVALYPSEKPVAKEVPIRSVEVVYPEARLPLLGINVHWLVAFFILSIVFGFSLKGLFKVEI